MRLLVFVVLLCGAVEAAGAEERQLEFRVTLDGSPIGYHRYAIEADGARERIFSEARFDVRFLFFTAFRYRHTNREIWDGECLLQLESETRINGRTLSVSGRQDGDYLVVDDGAGAARLDACVATFAYWDPQALRQSRLLDPQSGDYLPVTIEALPPETIDVRGETVPARVLRLTAREMDLTLWYSEQDEWLGLESVVKGGRVLRYELT